MTLCILGSISPMGRREEGISKSRGSRSVWQIGGERTNDGTGTKIICFSCAEAEEWSTWSGDCDLGEWARERERRGGRGWWVHNI